MTSPTAILDACVLYPAPLRDLLLWLALSGLYRPRWTEMIHEEWMRSLLEQRPELSRARLERTRELMDKAVPDCLVTGYEILIDGLALPDPDDRHVLAAAMHGGAETIVTYNLADFPPDTLAGQGLQAQHPDEFIAGLLDANAAAVCSAAKRQRETLKNPPKSVDEYLTTLAALSLPRTVLALTAFKDLL
jgi:hypothetical protein